MRSGGAAGFDIGYALSSPGPETAPVQPNVALETAACSAVLRRAGEAAADGLGRSLESPIKTMLNARFPVLEGLQFPAGVKECR